jgi:hypothetical protein
LAIASAMSKSQRRDRHPAVSVIPNSIQPGSDSPPCANFPSLGSGDETGRMVGIPGGTRSHSANLRRAHAAHQVSLEAWRDKIFAGWFEGDCRCGRHCKIKRRMRTAVFAAVADQGAQSSINPNANAVLACYGAIRIQKFRQPVFSFLLLPFPAAR